MENVRRWRAVGTRKTPDSRTRELDPAQRTVLAVALGGDVAAGVGSKVTGWVKARVDTFVSALSEWWGAYKANDVKGAVSASVKLFIGIVGLYAVSFAWPWFLYSLFRDATDASIKKMVLEDKEKGPQLREAGAKAAGWLIVVVGALLAVISAIMDLSP